MAGAMASVVAGGEAGAQAQCGRREVMRVWSGGGRREWRQARALEGLKGWRRWRA